ncbi:oligopeptide transport ATP-binding protein OppD [Ruminiclostridium hungatei]|uniref:Oligopeptide transport ATP-binding protein OppD n=1 Tax=Ruminiclostridium hungatei TaxID=48256 RepID=A0A1V4SH78_RUMHU|nr:ABC transporter ATP-binding protein [Ruminiclostridium hungatei]OPX42617.1 oligopeptide transport ATP-binding protein OppD [Ruminiclostridium hungatei]
MKEELLQVRNLCTYFYTDTGVVKAVNDVSFMVERGQTVGIVGESGCGKSVMAMSIMRLIQNPGKIAAGQVLFKGRDLAGLTDKQIRRINGDRISMIFQEPMTSLNPVFTVGNQIAEVLLLHRNMSKRQARERTVELITTVGIPRAQGVFDSYPHELSGGMRQRIMIAMALACEPELLIADEPTTALDVTIQAQILELLGEIKKQYHMSIILITHDLGVIAEMADYVIVMYAGKVVERGSVKDVFMNPSHPYTCGLLKSKPQLDMENERLYTIPGQVPGLIELPDACHFYDRCEIRSSNCKKGFPGESLIEGSHFAACIKAGRHKNE